MSQQSIIKGEKWAEFAQKDPRLAALVQTSVTSAVKDVEHHLGDLPPDEKHQKAQDQALEALQKLVVASSPAFGAYAPLVIVAAELIPYIDDAIKGIVEWFNFTGDFQHNSEGVA